VTVFPNLPAPKNSWGPNIGFAYAVGNGGRILGDNKTVIRGGYRLAYDVPYYNIYLNISSSAPQVLAQTVVPGVPLLAAPFGPANRTELAPDLTLGTFDPRTFNETNVSPNFKPDRVSSWSLGVQRELGRTRRTKSAMWATTPTTSSNPLTVTLISVVATQDASIRLPPIPSNRDWRTELLLAFSSQVCCLRVTFLALRPARLCHPQLAASTATGAFFVNAPIPATRITTVCKWNSARTVSSTN